MVLQFPHSSASRCGTVTPTPQHGPLEHVTRPMLTTEEAAFYLNRRPQTLRVWACTEEGPIRPVRVNGRLGWRVADVRRCLGFDPVAAV